MYFPVLVSNRGGADYTVFSLIPLPSLNISDRCRIRVYALTSMRPQYLHPYAPLLWKTMHPKWESAVVHIVTNTLDYLARGI